MNLLFLSKSHEEMFFFFVQKLIIKKKKEFINWKSRQFPKALETTF